jgi:N4-(beta-N-acetylglucosaminyl)-L-asparaginase
LTIQISANPDLDNKDMNRRRFITRAAFAATAISLENCAKTTRITQKTVEKGEKSMPVVVATWNRAAATKAAWAIISQKNGYALDALEAGSRWQESDENDQSVGIGGLPDRDGFVTLDACIMDEKGNAGSVCFVQNYEHPISIARKVMEKTPHVMLVGVGAEQFAESEGFKKIKLLTEKSRKDWENWKKTSEYKPRINSERHDTIGMVALDAAGRLAGTCTTSGMAFKMHGRVGDSPIIGAGMFCDGEIGAAAATGLGELMLKTLGSFLVVELMRQGKTPLDACREAVIRISKKCDTKDAQVGFIAVDKMGNVGAFGLRTGFNYTIARGEKVEILEADFLIK